MTPNEMTRTIFAVTLIVLAFLAWPSDAAAGEHQVYLGPEWIHLSAADGGWPVDPSGYEEQADHFGLGLKYQYVSKATMFYLGATIGQTRINGRDWECDGCSYPSSITMGFMWRVY